MPLAIVAASLLLAVVVAPRWLTPGFRGPRFAPCPASPNCVSSEASEASRRVEPFAFAGDPAAAMARARGVLLTLPRTQIAEEESGYLRAECRTRLFGFTDDVELKLGAGRIDVRSASRVGHSDWGANRNRVERLRAAFGAAR